MEKKYRSKQILQKWVELNWLAFPWVALEEVAEKAEFKGSGEKKRKKKKDIKEAEDCPVR